MRVVLSRRLALAIPVLTIVLAACGGGRVALPQTAAHPVATQIPEPTFSANPATLSANVLDHSTTGIYIGYDDHVSFLIENTGRDIGDVFIDLSLGDRWLDHHGIAMGTTARCDVEVAAHGVACGRIASGHELGVVLRATPDDPGTWHYGARFYDRTPAGLVPISRPDGGPLLVTFEEKVVPLPAT
ncbi:MAG: hypothetical protein M3024_13840 [Candidatus Dormibacteraeota bacterium]|nr:hypothetical protein [Candidatus Dormibacteraeota bacterium]